MNPIVKNGNKLRWKFENVSHMDKNGLLSDQFFTGALNWKIGAKRSKPSNFSQKSVLEISLNYESPNINDENWLCEVDAKFVLLKQGAHGEHIVENVKDCFHAKMTERVSTGVDWNTVYKDYIKEDSIVVEIEFNLKYYDFSKTIPNFTDVMINVENTNFLLNKSLLSLNSTHFATLLPYRDSNLIVGDTTTQHFCYFLASLNPFFNTDLGPHYQELIKLARNWGVPALHQKLEQFLISFSGIELIEKIKLADENDYEELMKNALDSIGSSDEVKALQRMVEFNSLTEPTKLRVMFRLLELV